MLYQLFYLEPSYLEKFESIDIRPKTQKSKSRVAKKCKLTRQPSTVQTIKSSICPKNPFFYQHVLAKDAVSYVTTGGRQLVNLEKHVKNSKAMAPKKRSKRGQVVIEFGT